MNYKLQYVVFLALFAHSTSGCPQPCTCKWKNGKQTVECVNKDLLVIPEGMDSGTQVLEFSGNNLRSLQREKFLKMDLTNLQRIYLSRCRLEQINDHTFKGLTNLIELDLSGNYLEFIPSTSFVDCPSLMKLTLNTNPIRTVKSHAFKHLSHLNTLEMSDCEINKIEASAFEGLGTLEWLSLNGNKLTTIKGTGVFPLSLKGVQLQENNWECDCHLVDLQLFTVAFKIPQNIEPVCKGPLRLEKRLLRTLNTVADLACLPEVSPTTFFLEIGEGRNISLLCQVSAVPEAKVSWWFQGQLLQNDSIIAPGLRLLYYVEEGRERKKSELFIYNANAEDNGTFVCSAENAAGVSQSNYTIRVVLKPEPAVEAVGLPFEIIAIVLAAGCITLVILVLIAILSCVKCCRDRRLRKKRESDKSLSNSSKDILTQDTTEEFSESSKDSCTAIDRQQMLFYAASLSSSEMLKPMSPVTTSSQTRSPSLSLRRFQLEQNPDLINDAEPNVPRRKDGDGKDEIGCSSSYTEETPEGVFEMQSSTFHGVLKTPGSIRRSNRDLYRMSADVHLTPVALMHTVEERRPFPPANCYRTLPYNRSGKRQSAANPTARFSREAEFLSQSVQPAAFEHFCENVRYTADGYPVRIIDFPPGMVAIPCTSDGIPACHPDQLVQWPPCLPGNLSRTGSLEEPPKPRKCVGAQTQTETEEPKVQKPPNKSICALAKVSETLTESPDEGYEGESAETSSNPC